MAMDGSGAAEERMVLSESQRTVLQKYLIGDERSWEDVARRVARYVASAERTPALRREWEEKFYALLAPMKLLPGGSILANSDHGTRGLLNCFVLSAEDNIQDIARLVTDAILTTKFRGGVGINVGAAGQTGYIRPKGSPFADGKALGPCAVLDMVSETSKKITTGNKSRRGAFMFSMHWKHPDIQEFIQAKTQSVMDAKTARHLIESAASLAVDTQMTVQEKNTQLAELKAQLMAAWTETHLSPDGKRDRRWHNANISVQVDDEFFRLLDAGDPYVSSLWDQIAQFAHDTADPGLLLVDNAKRRSPIRNYITTTNPCGEIWLPPNSACNLASLNIPRFVRRFGDEASIDFDDLGRAVETSVRFLDDVLDMAEFATEAQRHNVRNVYRQLGLGIMGWADWLKLVRIPYDSEEHLAEIDRVGRFIAERAYRASEALAAEKEPCGIWDKIADVVTGNPFERWTDAAGNVYTGDQVAAGLDVPVHQTPRRNSTVVSIAPTGSIAQLAGCSWAFEPDFGLTIWKQVYVDASRSQQNWVQILNPYLEELELGEEDRQIVLRTGSLAGTTFAREHPQIAAAFRISREISWQWHVLAQGRWQQWVDSSISKTINCGRETTVDEIKEMYRFAERNGLKGITVYREGTLESEPVKVGAIESNEAVEPVANGASDVEIGTLPNGNGHAPHTGQPLVAGERPAMLDEEVAQAASLIGVAYDDGPLYLSDETPLDGWHSTQFKGGCGGGVLHYQVWQRENGRRLLVVRSDSYSMCFVKN